MATIVSSRMCPQLATAIGDQREPGRCAQVRCPCCNGMGIFVDRHAESNPLRVTGTTA